MKRLTVRVPATSANVGPGFDSLGIAFALYNDFTFSLSEKTEILGCPTAYAGEDNLALVAFRAACRRAGREAPAVRIEISSSIPFSRGLGSSAALLVGGALGANLLCELGLSRDDVFAVATEIEGHPDNVAPAVYGGLTAAMLEDGTPIACRCPLHPSLRFCAFIPNFATDTRKSRTVLPQSFSRADAVYNISHATVLLSALATGDLAVLSRAMHDRLHEPYRYPIIWESEQVRDAAMAAGAHSFYISGSGSTCMAVYTDGEFPTRMEEPLSHLAAEWRIYPLSLDTEGARLLTCEE